MLKPLTIQILLSTYNGEKYLAQQLDSLLGQDYPDFNICIRDDGSSDSTYEILTDYQRKNTNISVFALHPGVVNTSFGSDFTGGFKILLKLMKPFMISANKGAKTSIYLASENNIEDLSGNYFINCKVKKPNVVTENSEIAKKLWEVSEKLVHLE